MFQYITPASYWVLTVLWLVILALYIGKFRESKKLGGAIAALLTVLAIDAFRTLFESIYFGLYFNSRFGLLPEGIFEVLSDPALLIIPKLVNVVAGIVVLFILLRWWVPKEISRRHRSEIERRQDEERFHDIANNVPGIVYQFKIDANGQSSYPYVSPTISKVLGLDPAAVMADPNVWFDIIHPEDKASLDASIENTFQTLDIWKWEGRMIHTSGDVKWFSGSSTPRKLEDGSILWNGVVFEITDLQNAHEQQRLSITEKAEKEIRDRQQLLFNAVEIMQDGFVLFDSEDKLVLCNQRYREIYHEVRDVLEVGATFTQIVEASAQCNQILLSTEDRDAWIETRIKQHLNPDIPFDQELTRGDWVRVVEQKTSDGGIVGLRIDITKEKEEEEKLRKLSQALEQSPSMVFITDINGHIEYINAAFRDITGYETSEVLGKNPRFLKSGETSPETYRELWGAILSGKEWRGELKDRRKDGTEVWVYSMIAPIKNIEGDTTHFVAMHEDITDRKNAALRERLAREEAESANSAKSEFLSAMSHELRTPLNAILGFAQLMESDPDAPLSGEQIEGVTHIIKSGNYLLELINEILDLSRIEAGKLNVEISTVPIAPVVMDCLNLINISAKTRNIDINLDRLNLATQTVLADPTRLKQAILNLLSNAVKYNVESGSITLIGSVLEGGTVRFEVEDSGIGIPASELPHLFTPFSRLGRSATEIEGTGIGLTITKKLAELMGGDIGLESEEGVGSRFWIDLPGGSELSETEMLTALPARNKGRLSKVDALRVLYVEDDPINVLLMEKLLQRHGSVELEVTHTAELGLSVIGNKPIDLVLMDVNLPGMSGLDAIQVLRRNEKVRHLPIVAISANATEADIQSGLDAGADAYLTKPIVISTFLQTLDKVLGQPGEY